MTVWDYFDRVMRECDDRSLRGDALIFSAMDETGDQVGRILGQLTFDVGENVVAQLHVTERVRIEDGRPVVFEYAYFLIVDGVEFWGWEIDLSHDPPVHRHIRNHERRLDADVVNLPQMIDQAWTDVSDYVRQLEEAEGQE